MSTPRVASVIAAGSLWRATGSSRLGRYLTDSLAGPDDDASMTAGMLLTKGGDRGVDAIQRALEAGATDRALITVLLSIGSARGDAVLAEVAASPGPLAHRAAQALAQREATRGDS